MASISMAMPLTSATQKKVQLPNSNVFLNTLPLKPSKKPVLVKAKSKAGLQVEEASFKEKAITGLTAAALTVSMVIPEVAEAAGSGVSPSLNNFLLSIAAGGVVFGVIVGAVIGVSNFDPVKRT